jgi:DNA polymerase II large subunit
MSGAIAGLAIGVVSTGISFAQANKQRNLQEKAEREADAAMQTARGKLNVNFAEQQAIKKESYELERDANLSAGAQAMAAGVEGGARGGAATAGRVLAQQNLAQSGTRVAMGEEMTNIEGAIIEEDSRLRDLGVALDLEEVAGNQQKAADARAAADAAKQQGVEGVVNTVGQAAEMVPLYLRDKKAQKIAVGGMSFNEKQFKDFIDKKDLNIF